MDYTRRMELYYNELQKARESKQLERRAERVAAFLDRLEVPGKKKPITKEARRKLFSVVK